MSNESSPGPAASREALIDLLRRWRLGVINERQVHELAESLWESYPDGPPTYPRGDPRSIAIEVLSQLEVLNVQLITPEDIPAFLEFLDTEAGQEQAAWEKWARYWAGVDFKRRLRELADNPYYSKSEPPSD